MSAPGLHRSLGRCQERIHLPLSRRHFLSGRKARQRPISAWHGRTRISSPGWPTHRALPVFPPARCGQRSHRLKASHIMPSTDERDTPPQNIEPGFLGWLNRRTGLDTLLATALYEPIPGGARLAYIFGSGLLFIFISQIITGVFLALYYVPSADHAHTTVAYITKSVTAGSFLRSLHFYGAYKGRRELLWLSGCVLFGLVLAMAFTGYLLPWDQRAYFATAVGTNAVSEVPLVGESLKRLIRGGTDMGTLTISRFFVAHVFLIPACIFILVASHIFLFRNAGAAGPFTENTY